MAGPSQNQKPRTQSRAPMSVTGTRLLSQHYYLPGLTLVVRWSQGSELNIKPTYCIVECRCLNFQAKCPFWNSGILEFNLYITSDSFQTLERGQSCGTYPESFRDAHIYNHVEWWHAAFTHKCNKALREDSYHFIALMTLEYKMKFTCKIIKTCCG